MGIERTTTAGYIHSLLPEFPDSVMQPYWYLLNDNNLWYYDTTTSGWTRSNKFTGKAVGIKIKTKNTVDGSIPPNTVYLDNQGLPTELLKAVKRRKTEHIQLAGPHTVYTDRRGARWLNFNILSKTDSENGVYTFTTHLYANKRFKFCNWARDKNNNIVRFNRSDEHVIAVKSGHTGGCSTLVYGYSTY